MTNNRRRGSSSLVVSFCNVKDRGKLVVATVDLREKASRVRWLEIKKDAFLRGATGLCYWQDMICVAHQGGPKTPPGFVILNPDQNYEKVHEGTLPPACGVHSVCAGSGGELYFVASRMDSVYRAAFDVRSREWIVDLYWIFPGSSGDEDEKHLNAIEIINDDLCVSGFGNKEADVWLSAKNGFVYNIERAEYLVKDIYHPHSLLQDAGATWISESSRSRVLSSAGDEIAFPLGYIRGLTMDYEHLYAGASKRRRVSESTGIVNPQVHGDFEGVCCVYRVDRTFGKSEILVDFSGVRNEIFELLLV